MKFLRKNKLRHKIKLTCRSERTIRWVSSLLILCGGLTASLNVSALETDATRSGTQSTGNPPTESKVATAPASEVRNQTRVAEMPQGVLQLDQTVISGNQELPKVLYILPWREPQGLPEIEVEAETVSQGVFRRLYPPAYRREMSYFETLNGIRDDQQNQEE